jgi:hypothetical protein
MLIDDKNCVFSGCEQLPRGAIAYAVAVVRVTDAAKITVADQNRRAPATGKSSGNKVAFAFGQDQHAAGPHFFPRSLHEASYCDYQTVQAG